MNFRQAPRGGRIILTIFQNHSFSGRDAPPALSGTKPSQRGKKEENKCNRNPLSQPARWWSHLVAVLAAFQSPAAPDLSIFGFGGADHAESGHDIDRPNRQFQQQRCITADVVFYRGSVFAGGAAQIDRQTVALAGLANTPVTTPTLATQEGELYSVCVNPGIRADGIESKRQLQRALRFGIGWGSRRGHLRHLHDACRGRY